MTQAKLSTQVSRQVIFVAALAALLGGPTLFADDSPSFAQSLKDGKATVNLRYRFENVSDDNVPNKDANASTLRTTLNYKSAGYKGFSLFLEAENVAVVGNDETYRNGGAGSLSNGVTDRPVVADPALTNVNQAYLRYESGDTAVAFGRQEINLGDQRFVGAVGWRQNHQSFDAITISNTSLEKTTITYAYLDKVHRIFGDAQPMSSHLLNAKIQLGSPGTLTVYGYLLDYDRAANAGLSTTTLGAEWVGNRAVGDDAAVLYELEFADQSDRGDNPNNIDANYLHASLGFKFDQFTLKAGQERLDGSPSNGQFRTPLATLHKFNGWADKFLGTPTNGLEDTYLSLAWKKQALLVSAIYHDFNPREGSGSYGEEIDLLLTWKSPASVQFGLKAALYDAGGFSSNTDKLMFWTAYKF
jgi:hypothetical protein